MTTVWFNYGDRCEPDGVYFFFRKKIVEIKSNVLQDESELLEFVLQDADGLYSALFYHRQDCCETAYLESPTVAELQSLVGQQIVRFDVERSPDPDLMEWTFFKIQCEKETVTLRFYGESNGYYSTDVDITIRWLGGENDRGKPDLQ